MPYERNRVTPKAYHRTHNPMSQTHQLDVACPKCGLSQTTSYWSSINVSLDPELRQQLFDGQINVFRCTACEAAVPISTTLMYHDMQRKFCVWYYPFNMIEDAATLDQFNTEGKLQLNLPELATKMMPSYMLDPPVVFHPDELLRYIEFREALHRHHHPDA